MIAKKILESVLDPKSIAVIGASNNKSKFGYLILEMLVSEGYKGKIYPVNPTEKEVFGLPCYSSIMEVPGDIDIAAILVPAERVLESCQACVSKGVKAAVIVTSGFAEAGEAGRNLQKSLSDLLKKTGLRVVGPNCEGLLNIQKKMFLSFSSMFRTLKPGPVSMISHSGGLCGIVSRRLMQYGVGMSKIISAGNESDLNAVDYMDYLAEDDDTRVIIAYLEQIREPRRFMERAKAISAIKPILVSKGGRTEIGKRAAASHTAALAGSDQVINAAFKQIGIIRAYDLQEMIDAAAVLGTQPLMKGKRVGILSGAGGLAVEMTDLCIEGGLEVPPISEKTSCGLKELIPHYGFAFNPIDMTGTVLSQPQTVKKALEILLQDENVDAVAFMLTIARQVEFARAVHEAAQSSSKPVLICWTAGKEITPEPINYFLSNGVPVFDTPIRVRNGLLALAKYSQYRMKEEGKKKIAINKKPTGKDQKNTAKDIIMMSRKENRTILSEHESKLVLSAYHIPVTREKVATSKHEIESILAEIPFPVVMKVDSPDILHKTEAGVVMLNISSCDEVMKAYSEILKKSREFCPEARINGVLIQQMMRDQVAECIVGIKKDDQFGPTVMVGMGGIFTEVFKDFSLRICPVSSEEAMEMIEEIKGAKIMKGYRGRPKGDLAKLAEMIAAISQLALDFEEHIAEIDMNPVMVFPEGKGVCAVDALIILTK
jgi:acyl-CoA synthetase (NDP forming)